MASTIKLKNGSGAPTTGDLVQGEPALDLTNKRLYTENASGVVIEVGTNPTSVTTGNITANGTINLTGATVSNAGSITTADINGGTIDGTVIGGSTAAAGSFTTLGASGTTTLSGALALTGNLDINTNKCGNYRWHNRRHSHWRLICGGYHRHYNYRDQFCIFWGYDLWR